MTLQQPKLKECEVFFAPFWIYADYPEPSDLYRRQVNPAYLCFFG